MRQFSNSRRRRRWRCIDDSLRTSDTGHVRDEEAGDGSETDDRCRDRNSQSVSHVEPGIAELDALRVGRVARVTREAKSAAFI